MKGAMKIITSLVAVLVLMAVSVTPAFGQTDPSLDGYSNVAGQQQDQVQGGLEQANGPVNDTAPASSSAAPASDSAAPAQPAGATSGGGGLPFTGIDVALLVGAGGVLLAAGFGMRRLTRAPSSV